MSKDKELSDREMSMYLHRLIYEDTLDSEEYKTLRQDNWFSVQVTRYSPKKLGEAGTDEMEGE